MYLICRFRRDALLGLERCAGEVVTDILHIIETCDPDEAQMRLFLREFPLFLDLFNQIKVEDGEFASQCLKHWTSFLRGPPNRPTDDVFGLVEVALHFLDACTSNTPQAYL
jgi:hypothetical protein